MPRNTDPTEKWNDPMYKDDPMAPWNDPVKNDPTACWNNQAGYGATLFPLKHYLMHHMELAKSYRGMLPFGGQVKAYINRRQITLGQSNENESPIWTATGSPTYTDHVALQKVTNEMADAFGVPSLTINNVMYLQGSKLKKAPSRDPEDGDSVNN